MNERLCCFVPRTAPVLNEFIKKKKTDPEEGLAELWTCGFEQWSYLVRNTNVYSIALFTIAKNRQTYKKSKNDKWLMLVRIYK